jgi:hypothetical protein
MSNYIDLVICKHPNCDKKYLFQAPRWTNLKPFDDVIVDTINGKQPAKVIESMTVEKNSDEYKFITLLVAKSNEQATLPLRKVLSRVVTNELKYDE